MTVTHEPGAENDRMAKARGIIEKGLDGLAEQGVTIRAETGTVMDFTAETSHDICRAHTAVHDGRQRLASAKEALSEQRGREKAAWTKLDEELDDIEGSHPQFGNDAAGSLEDVVKAYSAFKTEVALTEGQEVVVKASKEALKAADKELFSVIADAKSGQCRIDYGGAEEE